MSSDYPSNAGPGQQQGAGRPSMYYPQGLTTEESALLKKLRHESSWRRGYPLAVVASLITVAATTRRSSTVRIVSTIVAGITGNVVGKLSYIPTIQQRLVTDLPESSQIRQKMEAFQKGGAGAVLELEKNLAMVSDSKDEHQMQFDLGSEHDAKYFEHDESETPPPKTYTTYEELRKKHRSGSQATRPENHTGLESYPNVPSTRERSQVAHDVVADIEPQPITDSPAGKKVRYNKYGDPIID